tara:strand:+ start:2057 stop:2569 length:513 start_codon:yes stop_codon:yes gene_type:complete
MSRAYVDESAVAMAIAKISSMEGNITKNSVWVQGSFRGNQTSVKTQIETILNGWEDSGWLSSTKGRGGGKVFTVTETGWAELQKVRTSKAQWLVEAEELIESYGEALPVNWPALLEKASTKEHHRAWFQKIYLPWLQNDDYWLRDPDCPEGKSVNRKGIKEHKFPSCGFH